MYQPRAAHRTVQHNTTIVACRMCRMGPIEQRPASCQRRPRKLVSRAQLPNCVALAAQSNGELIFFFPSAPSSHLPRDPTPERLIPSALHKLHIRVRQLLVSRSRTISRSTKRTLVPVIQWCSQHRQYKSRMERLYVHNAQPTTTMPTVCAQYT